MCESAADDCCNNNDLQQASRNQSTFRVPLISSSCRNPWSKENSQGNHNQYLLQQKAQLSETIKPDDKCKLQLMPDYHDPAFVAKQEQKRLGHQNHDLATEVSQEVQQMPHCHDPASIAKYKQKRHGQCNHDLATEVSQELQLMPDYHDPAFVAKYKHGQHNHDLGTEKSQGQATCNIELGMKPKQELTELEEKTQLQKICSPELKHISPELQALIEPCKLTVGAKCIKPYCITFRITDDPRPQRGGPINIELTYPELAMHIRNTMEQNEIGNRLNGIDFEKCHQKTEAVGNPYDILIPSVIENLLNKYMSSCSFSPEELKLITCFLNVVGRLKREDMGSYFKLLFRRGVLLTSVIKQLEKGLMKLRSFELSFKETTAFLTKLKRAALYGDPDEKKKRKSLLAAQYAKLLEAALNDAEEWAQKLQGVHVARQPLAKEPTPVLNTDRVQSQQEVLQLKRKVKQEKQWLSTQKQESLQQQSIAAKASSSLKPSAAVKEPVLSSATTKKDAAPKQQFDGTPKQQKEALPQRPNNKTHTSQQRPQLKMESETAQSSQKRELTPQRSTKKEKALQKPHETGVQQPLLKREEKSTKTASDKEKQLGIDRKAAKQDTEDSLKEPTFTKIEDPKQEVTTSKPKTTGDQMGTMGSKDTSLKFKTNGDKSEPWGKKRDVPRNISTDTGIDFGPIERMPYDQSEKTSLKSFKTNPEREFRMKMAFALSAAQKYYDRTLSIVDSVSSIEHRASRHEHSFNEGLLGAGAYSMDLPEGSDTMYLLARYSFSATGAHHPGFYEPWNVPFPWPDLMDIINEMNKAFPKRQPSPRFSYRRGMEYFQSLAQREKQSKSHELLSRSKDQISLRNKSATKIAKKGSGKNKSL